MSERGSPSGAARCEDEIGHDFGLVGMVAGVLVGAAVGAAIVGAGVATGGLAVAAIVGGAIAMGGLSGGSLAHGLQTVCDIPDPATGVLTAGSKSVFVNSRNAQRAGIDGVDSCHGLYGLNHWPRRMRIAQGSATVFVNGFPMARTSDKMECGAAIKLGSSNVFVGGKTATVLDIDDAEAAYQAALELLGLASLGLAGVAALAAGFGECALLGSVVAFTDVGTNALKSLGDSLGPGWGDILTGVAGFAMLGLGAKLSVDANKLEPRKSPINKGNDARSFGGKSVKELSDAAKAPDPSDRSGELTRAGRALHKHGGRDGSAFPAAKGSPSAINRQGQAIVDEILSDPGSIVIQRNTGRFGDVLDIVAPDGRGLRYSIDGKFITFLEP